MDDATGASLLTSLGEATALPTEETLEDGCLLAPTDWSERIAAASAVDLTPSVIVKLELNIVEVTVILTVLEDKLATVFMTILFDSVASAASEAIEAANANDTDARLLRDALASGERAGNADGGGVWGDEGDGARGNGPETSLLLESGGDCSTLPLVTPSPMRGVTG